MDEIEWKSDYRNGVSSTTGRLVDAGVRTAQVKEDASAKVQIAALLDLLDLHLSNADAGQEVTPDNVTLRVPDLRPEARGALGTLVASLNVPIKVNVLESDGPKNWVPAEIGWDANDPTEYKSYRDLLERKRPVPSLVSQIVEASGLPALRAYPMLSTKAGWSLRLEGLEVAQATAKGVTLKVGKDGKLGGRSRQRKVWTTSTNLTDPLVTSDAAEAVRLISTFAQAWDSLGETSDGQDEHALESRILRGAAQVDVSGRRLDLIESDPVVNWGSQFPTKWGPGGRSRYLDALLRDGTAPWAIEMKVEGAGGVGQYYRHAVAQAVLYREFIRRARPLHDWFKQRDLLADRCEAAVVVPQIAKDRKIDWRGRVARLCEAFGVALVEVDPEHARRHPPVSVGGHA